MNATDSQGKHVLFISELPDNIMDSELHDFFAGERIPNYIKYKYKI